MKRHRLNQLKQFKLLKSLTDEDLLFVGSFCVEKNFGSGEVLFYQGEEALQTFLILKGEVEVWVDFEQENKDLLAVHGVGHLFGEMALIDGLQRSATIVTKTPVEALIIERDNFLRIINECSSFSLSLLQSFSDLVRKSNYNFVSELRQRNRNLESVNQRLMEAHRKLVLKERLAAIGSFSSMIMHDINNPISVIRGYSEMIQMSPGDEEKTKRFAQIIEKEVDRLKNLTGELLDYSKGEMRLNLRVVDLKELIENSLKIFKMNHKSNPILVSARVDYSGPVLVDRERLLRSLLNLLDNSRKACSSNGIITVRSLHRNNSFYLLVQDNGEGMEQETLKRIFEPFYSVSGKGGTGLGMVIVKNVVEAHGGSVSIKSSLKKGTRVALKFPLTEYR